MLIKKTLTLLRMFKSDPRYTSEMIVNTLIPYRSRQIRFYNQRA